MRITSDNIRGFLAAAGRLNWSINSLIVYQAGEAVFEGSRWPYALDQLHSTHSATKAFTGTAVGLAVGDGLLSLEEKVVDFFGGVAARRLNDASPNLLAMTVGDLLTMRTGHAQGISGGRWRLLAGSWVEDFLAQDVENRPGERFEYSSANSHMLSAIVQKRVGAPISEYLAERLFLPLGIGNFVWDCDPEGISTGGNGLKLSPRDLLKWGVLYLQNGEWNGQQIVPRDWVAQTGIARSTWSVEFEAGHDVFDDRPRSMGYGYQVYSGPYGSFSASGMFGQKCVVYPQHEAVVAINAAIPHHEDSQFIHLIDEYLIPGETRVATNVSGEGTGIEMASAPGTLPVLGELSLPAARFATSPNVDQVDWIEIDTGENGVQLRIADHRGIHTVVAGLGAWVRSRTSLTTSMLHHSYQEDSALLEAGAMVSRDGTVVLKCYFVETPFAEDITLTFQGETLTLTRSVNINDGPTARPPVVARLVSRKT